MGLLALLLAAAAMTTTDLFAPDGERLGAVREGPGGSADEFDKESRRVA
jgi:hypothetical protein